MTAVGHLWNLREITWVSEVTKTSYKIALRSNIDWAVNTLWMLTALVSIGPPMYKKVAFKRAPKLLDVGRIFSRDIN